MLFYTFKWFLIFSEISLSTVSCFLSQLHVSHFTVALVTMVIMVIMQIINWRSFWVFIHPRTELRFRSCVREIWTRRLSKPFVLRWHWSSTELEARIRSEPQLLPLRRRRSRLRCLVIVGGICFSSFSQRVFGPGIGQRRSGFGGSGEEATLHGGSSGLRLYRLG